MTEIEKLRKELNDRLDAFEQNKPKCEIGKWYRTGPGSLYFIKKINGDMCSGYGLGYDNKWVVGDVCYVKLTKRIATDAEVDEMLKKEYNKLGYVRGKFYDLKDGSISNTCSATTILFETKKNSLWVQGCGYVMLNGIWATPIKEKTIEEWGEEFREFFTRRGHKTFAQDFCEFITKNNFKLPT